MLTHGIRATAFSWVALHYLLSHAAVIKDGGSSFAEVLKFLYCGAAARLSTDTVASPAG